MWDCSQWKGTNLPEKDYNWCEIVPDDKKIQSLETTLTYVKLVQWGFRIRGGDNYKMSA